jgi:WD40 repeat protein
MIYAVGALIVVKSVDEQKDRFLKGHTSTVTVITVSGRGSMIASGETHDQRSEECAALIIWDFASLDILYRVRFHKQMVQALSFSCDE